MEPDAWDRRDSSKVTGAAAVFVKSVRDLLSARRDLKTSVLSNQGPGAANVEVRVGVNTSLVSSHSRGVGSSRSELNSVRGRGWARERRIQRPRFVQQPTVQFGGSGHLISQEIFEAGIDTNHQ